MDSPVIVEGDDAPLSADIDDFIEIPEGMRWECIGCGSCCGNIFSKTWLDVYLTEFIGESVNGYCKYLDTGNGNRCRRYETRPNICRGYPFVIKKKSKYYVLTVHGKCKGIGNGILLDVRSKMEEVLKLVEDDLDVEFIVRAKGENDFRLYKLK